MWARIAELLFAVWLIVSRLIFSYDDIPFWPDCLAAMAIVLFSLLSFIDRLNKMHLLQILPAAWLLYVSYTYPTPWLPSGLQNHIILGLLLLLFAIIPSRASEPPRPWKKELR